MTSYDPSRLLEPSLALSALDATWIALRAIVALLGLLMAAGTLASLTRLPWWFVRGWDFPRLQIAAIALACGMLEPILAAAGGGTAWYDWAFLAAMLVVAAWQGWRIHEYTRVARREVQPATARLGDPNVVRVVISNVLEENREFEKWRSVVVPEDPDIVAVAEVNDDWLREIGQALDETHPHRMSYPQSNCYGMALWSRLPLHDSKLEFIVQDDIPSIHASVELKDGSRATLHCLHPRPPTPQEGDSSAPRDAELVIVGKRIRKEREDGHAEPTLVVGDLNDVAWSRTTRLFQKLSGLLDPRRGRGMYNTFNANSRFFRFPLDHVFISREFRLVDLRVLGHVGSDHFPVSITISHEPEKQADQGSHYPAPRDEAEPRETIQAQQQREREGKEEGHLSDRAPPDHSP
jgi:endonuclease/exonuclease/phosphatase (EEP) superfamily protein YafD